MDIRIINKYISEKEDQLSNVDIEALINDPIKLMFIREHLYSDILVNKLKQAIISEAEFYERKAFLISVETFLFKIYLPY